jgi:GNAT superfamily N-acetyltransferase
VKVRQATEKDYETFARLFPELRTPDPVISEERWLREHLGTTLVAEREGRDVGIAFYQALDGVGFLRMIMTDPSARRAGVGRALMTDVRLRFKSAGCSEWVLNVLPENVAAISLYESFGLRPVYRSRVVFLRWNTLDNAPRPSSRAREITPADDARVEQAAKIVPGLVADLRAKGNRVLRMIESDAGEIAACALFDPSFPGAYPFWARTPELAVALLHDLRPHKQPIHEHLSCVLADQPDIADALVALGGEQRLETMHMRGPL